MSTNSLKRQEIVFQKLFETEKSVPIHNKNLTFLGSEI